MRVDRELDRRALIALAAAMLLSVAIRLPALTWPLHQQPASFCCGHPDEGDYYAIFSSFGSTWDDDHPPGFAFAVYLADRLGLGRVAQLLIPPEATDRARTRGVYTARLVSLLCSLVVGWLVYVLGRRSGMAGPFAASASALVLFSPLFSVYSMYGLPDVLNMALILGYVYVFLQLTESPASWRLLAFAFLVGGAFAVKLGVLIAAPLVVHVVLLSARRAASAALLGLGLTTGAFVVSGGSFNISRMRMAFDMVYSQSLTIAERTPTWNMIHYLLSSVAGIGVHFGAILVLSLFGWLSWIRMRSLRDREAMDTSWLAVALGCVLHFVVISNFGAPFTRHMLPLYPFLAIFGVVGLSYLDLFRRRIASAALLIVVVVLGALASRPVLRSFRNDPNVTAGRWLQTHAGVDECILFTKYAERTQDFLGRTARAGCQEGRSPRFMVIHSQWSGRVTGRWWLKPRPGKPGDVYKFGANAMLRFDDRSRELEFWQSLDDGRAGDWRIVARFGDDSWTGERLFLRLVGRGYDQFTTPGEIVIAERADTN